MFPSQALGSISMCHEVELDVKIIEGWTASVILIILVILEESLRSKCRGTESGSLLLP